MSIVAAIDLGSNTVKLTVAQLSLDVASRGANAGFQVLSERIETTRVGEGLDRSGVLLPAAAERTLAALSAFVAHARELGAERVACVATAGLRDAQNGAEFVTRARVELNLDIEIIDGGREAELSYRAPAAMFGPGPLVVVDVGGRSTEIVTGVGAQVHDRVSLPLGGVGLTERFLPTDPPTAAERSALERFIGTTVIAAPAALADATLVGVSGTVVSLLGVHLGFDDMRRVVETSDGDWLPTAAVAATIEDLARKPAAARIRGSVIPPGRADVIVAGATVLLAVCNHYRATKLRVTHRGVRFGLLTEMLATLAE